MNHRIATFLTVACIAAAPNNASAAVLITEIMYDLPGSDGGREWIEMTNTGAGALDVSAYKFVEANTNHALTVLSGSAILPPQGAAVIAGDEAKFRADNPSFGGVLFRASFSLSNTGEALALADESGNIVDSVSYDVSAGGGGDGATLHRTPNDSFISGAPTPGVFSEQGETTPVSGEEEPLASEAPSPPTSSGTAILQYEVDAGGNRMVEAGAGSFFEGKLYSEKGVPLSGSRYIWNFGNGEIREGKSVFYAYPYPGVYSVLLSVDVGNGYAAMDRVTVTAVETEVSLRIEKDGSLTIFNETHAKQDLDVSLWILERGGVSFAIPRGTMILPGQGVRFAKEILAMPDIGPARLRYPSGVLAVEAEDIPKTLSGITYVASKEERPPASPVPKSNEGSLEEETVAAIPPAQSLAAVGAAGVPEEAPSLYLYLLGLLAIIVLGVAGSLYVRPPLQEAGKEEEMYEETDRLAREFTIHKE